MLKNDETLALIRLAQGECEQAKTTLIENNSPLIKSVIRRYKNLRIDYEDLYQLGCLGFLKAIKNFDESFNVKFSTYAVPMIAGEVKRFLRDDGSIKVSRSIKSLAIKVNRYVEGYKNEHFVKPNINQIAEEFNLSKSEIVFAMESARGLVSLDDKQSSTSTNSRTILETVETEDKTEKMLDLILLKDAIEELEPRDKKIILMRYFRDQTQSEIALTLGVSQVQVSRLEYKILENLKTAFRL